MSLTITARLRVSWPRRGLGFVGSGSKCSETHLAVAEL